MKKILASLALAALAVGNAAEATTYNNRGNTYHQAHYQLAMTAERSGVRVRLNSSACHDGRGAFGWYSPSQRLIMICQERALANGTVDQEVAWTAEDYDTLRHEVQHMVQDCMVGANNDGLLGAVYKQPIQMAERVLGQNQLKQIAQSYYANGADDHTVLMEFEAFAVAALDDPQEQIRDIHRYCM